MEHEPSFFLSYTLFVYLYYIGWILLGIASAVWIYKDAHTLPKLFLGSKPSWWALAAIILGPIFTMLAYWFIHHSTISNRVIGENENT